MKSKNKCNLLPLLMAAVLLLSGCGASTSPTPEISTQPTQAVGHEPITEELIKILDEQPQVKVMLEKSIEKAKEINPDTKTNPAQSLEQYYDYIDWAAKAMPWNISQYVDSESLYTKIDQSLNYFYFINDQPLEELEGRGLYNSSLQYAEPYRSWLIEFTKQWGGYLSTEDSWSRDYYKLAYADERFGLQGSWYESPDNWTTFNEFFSRKLASADQRPISAPEDTSVVVSPADSTPQGVWDIDEENNIVQKDGVSIKSQTFNSVSLLLGEDSAYAGAFAGGILTHTFLDVHDYHRYHFPVSGTIMEVTHIPQDDAVGGWVEWNAETGMYVLSADLPGWQMIETRSCVIVETEQHGLVALLPVGMSQVSSVSFSENVAAGETVKKGDELGYFLFGGSDFIMLFQKQAGFTLTAPTEREAGEYAHILMGEEYGRLGG